jgi:hypothetical protein
MIINELKVINLFCELDDFVTAFDKMMADHSIQSPNAKSVNRPEISISEMMCLEILYHHSGYKCFQYYYKQEVEKGYPQQLFSCRSLLWKVCAAKAPNAYLSGALSKPLPARTIVRDILCRFDDINRMQQQEITNSQIYQISKASLNNKTVLKVFKLSC